MSSRNRRDQDNSFQNRSKGEPSRSQSPRKKNLIPPPAANVDSRPMQSTGNIAASNQASTNEFYQSLARINISKGNGKAPASTTEAKAAPALDLLIDQPTLIAHKSPSAGPSSTGGPSTTNQIKEDEILALRVKTADTEAETDGLQAVLDDKKEELQGLKDELRKRLPGNYNAYKKKFKAAKKVVEGRRRNGMGIGSKRQTKEESDNR